MNDILKKTKKLLQYTSLYWLAVGMSLVLWSRDWEIIRLGAIKQYEDLIGIFAFCIFCVIAFIIYVEIKPYKNLSNEKLISIGLPYLVCLFFLAQITEFRVQSWDYEQYEVAFRAIVNGTNPYLDNRYLYPPVFADMMVFVYRIGLRVFPFLGIGKSEWIFVFYIHQVALLFFLLLSYFLSLEFAKKIGFKDLQSSILVSVIFIFNVPILRTLSANQVNFYILVSILMVLVFLNKYPFIAGMFVAFGGVIKLYPFMLSVPLFMMRKWRTLLGMIAGLSTVILFQTNFFRDFELWKQFFSFYLSFPIEQESLLFRNSSPMSFLRSSFTFLGFSDELINITSIFAILSILLWFAIRFYQREKMNISQGVLTIDSEYFRSTSHLLDFSVISLLIAPSAWEHHYIIAIPLMIWVFAIRSNDAPILTAVGFILVFALPVFNIYPFSYLRLVGILLLLILASPYKIKRSFSVLS